MKYLILALLIAGITYGGTIHGTWPSITAKNYENSEPKKTFDSMKPVNYDKRAGLSLKLILKSNLVKLVDQIDFDPMEPVDPEALKSRLLTFVNEAKAAGMMEPRDLTEPVDPTDMKSRLLGFVDEMEPIDEMAMEPDVDVMEHRDSIEPANEIEPVNEIEPADEMVPLDPIELADSLKTQLLQIVHQTTLNLKSQLLILLNETKQADTMKPFLIVPDLMKPDELMIPEEMKPEVMKPDVMIPDLIIPDVMVPEVMKPDLMIPDVMVPEVMKPDVMMPDLMVPGVMVPDVMKPDVMQPNVMQTVDPIEAADSSDLKPRLLELINEKMLNLVSKLLNIEN
jgi:hypothetical protein